MSLYLGIDGITHAEGIEKAKENMEKKKETAQISLFGGVV